MNFNSVALRAMIGKDVRQLVPLLSLLLGLCLVTIFAWNLADVGPPNLRAYARFIPLGIPGLCAVGTGAILVGLERENRTLRWLTSLPVSPAGIFFAKLVAGLIGLAAAWGICWGVIGVCLATGILRGPLAEVFSGPPGGTPLRVPTGILFWHVNSVYILLCSFLCGWAIRNPLASLLAIGPLAWLPGAATWVVDSVRAQRLGRVFVDASESGLTVLGFTLVLGGIVGWSAYRAATKSLGPAAARRIDDTTAGNAARNATRDAAAARSVSPKVDRRRPFRSPVLAMLWQSVHQSRLSLFVLAAALALGAFVVPAAGHLTMHVDDAWLVVPCCLAALSVMWLGVYAFAGDGSAAKMTFFASRGVSPVRLWIGRHLLGWTLFCAAAVLYLGVGAFLPQSVWVEQTQAYRSPSSPPLLPVAMVVLTGYSIAQMFAQAIKSSATAVILAPILTVSLVGWAFGCSELQYGDAGGDRWIVVWAVYALVPLGWTMLAMRAYSEDRRGVRFYLQFAAVVIGLFVVPLLSAASYRWSTPGMNKATHLSLSAASETFVREHPAAVRAPLRIGIRATPLADVTPPLGMSVVSGASVGNAKERCVSPESVLGPLEPFREQPAYLEPYAFRASVASLCESYARYRSRPEDRTRRQKLQDWIAAMARIADCARRVPRFQQQDQADRAECVLVVVIASDSYRPLFNSPTARAARRLVCDDERRSRARMNTLLVAWKANTESRRPRSNASSLRQLANPFLRSGLARRWAATKRTDSLADHLLEMINAHRRGESVRPAKFKLYRLLYDEGGDEIAFRGSPYGDASVDPERSAAVTVQGFTGGARFSQWFGGWEQTARTLAVP